MFDLCCNMYCLWSSNDAYQENQGPWKSKDYCHPCFAKHVGVTRIYELNCCRTFGFGRWYVYAWSLDLISSSKASCSGCFWVYMYIANVLSARMVLVFILILSNSLVFIEVLCFLLYSLLSADRQAIVRLLRGCSASNDYRVLIIRNFVLATSLAKLWF